MLRRVLCFLSAGILLAQTAADPRDTARKALDLLLAEKYSELIPMFSTAGKAANTEAVLSKNGAEIRTWGAVQNIGTATVRTIGTASIVAIPVKFATQDVTFQLSLNEKLEVAVILHTSDPWKHPAYSKPDSYLEREVTIGSQWRLSGMLTVPAGTGPFPGIVLVHDAGPGDRDESIAAVKVFKDLAEGLASRGVVVLRYEKRTRAYPAVQQKRDYTAEAETIDDAVLAAAVLRSQPEVKAGRVFELGYGFGGYLMPRIAEADGKLAGMVIVNGNARPLEDVALDEAQYLGIKGPQFVVIQEQAAKIKKLTPADDDAAALLGKFGPYLLDLKGYDPTGQSKLLGIPMLILQGERSFPVNMKDFAVWKTGLQGQKNVMLKSYPALDRVLVPGTEKSAEADYRKPGQHVSPDVIEDLAKWLNQ